MKKLPLFLSLLFLTVAAGNALAQCPKPPSGPYQSNGHVWYDYTQNQACYSLSDSSITADTVSCSFASGWRFNTTWSSTASVTFPISLSEPRWEADVFVDASSPSATWFDSLEVDAYVHHADGSQSPYTLFYWNGTMAPIAGCNIHVGSFTPRFAAGDTMKIQVRGSNSGGATLRVSVPRIFSIYP